MKDKLYVIDLAKGPESLKSYDAEAIRWVSPHSHGSGNGKGIVTCHSTTAEIEGTEDKIIVGAKYGYALWTRANGKLEYIKRIWDDCDGSDKENR